MINNLEYLRLEKAYGPKLLRINSLTHLEYDCDIFVVTVVTI